MTRRHDNIRDLAYTIFVKALYQSTLHKHFTKHFTKALYTHTWSNNFTQALYQSTLLKHFTQALDQITLHKHFIKVILKQFRNTYQTSLYNLSIGVRYYEV